MTQHSADSLAITRQIQRSLQLPAPAKEHLDDSLADVFTLLMRFFGSQDGRLTLNYPPLIAPFMLSVSPNQQSKQHGETMRRLVGQDVESLVYEDGRERVRLSLDHEVNWLLVPEADHSKSTWQAVCVPVIAGESVIGTIHLQTQHGDSFGFSDLTSALLLAGHVSMALQKLHYQLALNVTLSQLEEIQQYNQDLAAVLVHDLQVPLGNVVTSLELLQTGLATQNRPGLESLVDIAARSSKHLHALVDSLMDISRLEAGQPISDYDIVDILDMIDFVADVEGPDFEQRQVTLVRDISSDLPPVMANKDMIQRVLLNLLDNALKVSKAEQHIVIKAREDHDSGRVIICVMDEGPGIPLPDRERIFEKYQRVNDGGSSKGLGLGLAFCRLAVEAHGGQIWLEETDTEGACFCFTLPVVSRTQD